MGACPGRKRRAAAPIASPGVGLCSLPGFASSQGTGGRRAKSWARAGYKLVLSALLATIALFTASTVSTHAQVTNWTGTQSTDWFTAGNWTAGVPTNTPPPGTSVNIDTILQNPTITRAGASAFNVNVGQVATGMLVIQNGGTLTDQAASVGLQTDSQGTVVVTGAGSSWTDSGLLVDGFFGTGTVTIENGGVVNSDGGFVGAVGTGTVIVTGTGSTWSSSSGLTIGLRVRARSQLRAAPPLPRLLLLSLRMPVRREHSTSARARAVRQRRPAR